MILSIDGVDYDVMCQVRRSAEVRGSDISGDMLDGNYFNDVMGTYYGYDITLSYPLYNQDKYAEIYEALTAPVDAHAFVLPYNQGTIELTARVETVTDDWIETDSGFTYWRNTVFSIIPNGPSRQLTLEEAIARGITPLPDVAEPEIGDAYTYTAQGWVASPEYDNADNIYY